MSDITNPSTSPVTSAFLYRLDELTPDEMRLGMERLEKELHVGTDAMKDGTGQVSRKAVVNALDRAPGNYMDAVRILAVVKREYARITTEIEKMRAAIRLQAREDLIKSGVKSPTGTMVVDRARSRYSRWSSLADEEADIQAALDIAEAMARAWRDREASLRKMVESGY